MNASGGAASGSNRAFRGGGKGSNAYDCTVSFRNGNYPNSREDILGFRLVRSAN